MVLLTDPPPDGSGVAMRPTSRASLLFSSRRTGTALPRRDVGAEAAATAIFACERPRDAAESREESSKKKLSSKTPRKKSKAETDKD
jgi:hypothetical protein